MGLTEKEKELLLKEFGKIERYGNQMEGKNELMINRRIVTIEKIINFFTCNLISNK